MEDWINYLEEEEGKSVIKDDYGFLVYKIMGEELYIDQFYVKKEFRHKGHGQRFGKWALDQAKEHGCKTVTANIFIDPFNKKSAMRKVKIFGEFGFDIVSAQNNVITIMMEVSR